MFGRKHRDDDLRSTGVIKWVNKFFRFILFPFIHPMVFVSLIIVLLIIGVSVPLYYGISIVNIPAWYMQQMRSYYHRTENAVEENVLAPVKEKVADIQNSVGYDITVKTVEKKPNKDDMVAYATPQSVNRKLFAQAQEIPVDIKATIQAKKEATAADSASSAVKFKPINGLGLSYLDTPKELSGRAVIVNPNELMVNGTAIFLYGIYTSPSSSEGRKAVDYLKNSIGGKDVTCFVGAYTKDGMPTAICFYNDVNINQRLIDLKYAKNVGLN